MQVGSIVECIEKFHPEFERLLPDCRFPELKVMYTVRDISTDRLTGIRLEEIVNPKCKFADGFEEPAFDIKQFRELLPPVQIEELIGDALTAKTPEQVLVKEFIEDFDNFLKKLGH